MIAPKHGRRIARIPAAVRFWGVFFWAVFCWAGPGAAAEPESYAPTSYVLALGWQAAFCADRAEDAACAMLDEGDWAARNFALHGLWPNVDRNHDDRINADDNYCLPERDRGAAMDARWADLPALGLSDAVAADLAAIMPGTANGLDRYQWVKHGTCSGLDPERYFAAAIARTGDVAGIALARFVAANIGNIVTRRDMIEQFEMDFGKGSGRALRLFCSRSESAASLIEIRLALRVGRIEEQLTRGSLVIPPAAKAGTCPTRFRIARAGR